MSTSITRHELERFKILNLAPVTLDDAYLRLQMILADSDLEETSTTSWQVRTPNVSAHFNTMSGEWYIQLRNVKVNSISFSVASAACTSRNLQVHRAEFLLHTVAAIVTYDLG